jgi:ABC-type amino acid transport system permease subunit
VICSVSFNAPVILLLMLSYLIMSSVFVYTTTVSVIAAIFAIGLNNGAAAGDSLVQAKKTLPTGCGLLDASRVCVTQIRACVINAAKASPVAAFIGTPELLSTLTDIMSFSGERVAAFTLLALFYLIIVQLVIMLSARAAQWLVLPIGKVSHAR